MKSNDNNVLRYTAFDNWELKQQNLKANEENFIGEMPSLDDIINIGINDRDSILNDFNQSYLEKCQKDIYSEGNQLSSDDELDPNNVFQEQKLSTVRQSANK